MPSLYPCHDAPALAHSLAHSPARSNYYDETPAGWAGVSGYATSFGAGATWYGLLAALHRACHLSTLSLASSL